MKKLTELIPDDRNANKHSPEGMALLQKGLRENGLGRSILISSDNKIIAGNGVTESAGSIGIENLRVIDTDGSEVIAVRRTDIKSGTREFYNMALSDNIIAKENIVMDAEVVDAICEEYEIEDWKSDDQIAEAVEDKFDGVAPKEPITVLGDLYEIGSHRLFCGSSTEADAVAKLLNGKEPYLMVTDPPYGVVYEAAWRDDALSEGKITGRAKGKVSNDNNADWTEAWALSPSKVAYIYHADKFSGTVQKSLEDCDFYIRCQIVWVKSHFAIGRGDYHHKHEPCWYAVKKGSKGNWASDRKQTTVWEIPKPQKNETGHSTQKPVECMAKPIGNHDGDVYDPFLGSGSTMVASHQLNRKCYGMELDPKYCDVIVSRMIKLDPTLPIKRNGNILTKDQLAAFTTNTESK
jgi:DNA modification methylase